MCRRARRWSHLPVEGVAVLYLSASSEPRNVEEFVRAIEGGLREVLQVPADKHPVDVRGNYPGLDQLAVDVTGCRADAERRVARPRPSRAPPPGATVESGTVPGPPVQVALGRGLLGLSDRAAHVGFE